MIIALIPCTAKKLDHAAPAKELYCSDNFRKLLRITELQNVDKVLILSGLHHVVELDTVLEPYDYTLEGKPVMVKREFGRVIAEELSKRFDLESDEFIIYTPSDYNYFADNIKHKKFPLKGLSQGKRAQKINEILNNLEGERK